MLLLIDNVSKSFGPQVLYAGVTLQLNKGERWALVGPNGAGKTTLLRMILGQEVPDEGTITLAKDTSLGYLEQEVHSPTSEPALSEVVNSVKEIKELEKTIAYAQEALAKMPESSTLSSPQNSAQHPAHKEAKSFALDATQSCEQEDTQLPAQGAKQDHAQGPAQEQQKLLDILGNAQHRFEELGGYELEAKAKQIMAGLGFSESDFSKPANEFSGGWQMRLALAKLLLKHPDILLLDEPTNHLDLESVRWFESFLSTYTGTVLIVSHDRSFMDATVDHVAALENRTLRTYVGNYSKHLKLREANLEQLRAKRAAQEKEIAHMQVFVDKFRYKATKAKAAQERMARIEQIKQNLVVLPEKTHQVRFTFPQPKRTLDLVVDLEHVSKTYETALVAPGHEAPQKTPHSVYEDLSLKFYRGDRVALVGPNGAGKSTLMKLIAQTIEPTKGSVELGNGVEVAYYAQHTSDALNASHTVLQELGEAATSWTTTEQRRLLGAFLFTGDDVEKRVAQLSGGEKARLALAKMLVKPAPLLCLDEPTNHLDIDSVSVLEAALQQYAGTIILISHDEALVRSLANKVVDVRDGTARVFEGDFDYYLYKRADLERANLKEQDRGKVPGSFSAFNKAAPSDKTAPSQSAPSRAAATSSSSALPYSSSSSSLDVAPGAPTTSPSRPRTSGPKSKEQKRREAEERNRNYQLIAAPKKRMTQIEELLGRKKKRYQELMDLLADNATYENKELFDSAMVEYPKVSKEITALEDEWLELSLKLEEITSARKMNETPS